MMGFHRVLNAVWLFYTAQPAVNHSVQIPVIVQVENVKSVEKNRVINTKYYPTMIKEGDKVRIKGMDVEGYLVKVYYDSNLKSNMHLICKIAINAPPLDENVSIDIVRRYLEDLSKNLQTRLICQTVKLDSPDELEKVE